MFLVLGDRQLGFSVVSMAFEPQWESLWRNLLIWKSNQGVLSFARVRIIRALFGLLQLLCCTNFNNFVMLHSVYQE